MNPARGHFAPVCATGAVARRMAERSANGWETRRSRKWMQACKWYDDSSRTGESLLGCIWELIQAMMHLEPLLPFLIGAGGGFTVRCR